MCEICNNESGGHDVGIASIPGVPMSIMWCSSCLVRSCAVPLFVFIHDREISHGDINYFAPWALERETWNNGKYITFLEYMKENPHV